jgi:hypothetical protein
MKNLKNVSILPKTLGGFTLGLSLIMAFLFSALNSTAQSNISADFNFATDGLTAKLKDNSRGVHKVLGWTFGDGSGVRNESTVKHTYKSGGTYKAAAKKSAIKRKRAAAKKAAIAKKKRAALKKKSAKAKRKAAIAKKKAALKKRKALQKRKKAAKKVALKKRKALQKRKAAAKKAAAKKKAELEKRRKAAAKKAALAKKKREEARKEALRKKLEAEKKRKAALLKKKIEDKRKKEDKRDQNKVVKKKIKVYDTNSDKIYYFIGSTTGSASFRSNSDSRVSSLLKMANIKGMTGAWVVYDKDGNVVGRFTVEQSRDGNYYFVK